MLYAGILRACAEIVLEFLDRDLAAFRKRFDAAVLKVLYVTPHLVPRGGPLHKKPETDALHQTAYNKSSGDLHKTVSSKHGTAIIAAGSSP
jgi:hypothetical protein